MTILHCIYFKRFTFFYLKGKERVRERERCSIIWLTLLNGCSGGSWSRAKSFCSVSHLGARGVGLGAEQLGLKLVLLGDGRAAGRGTIYYTMESVPSYTILLPPMTI